MSIRITTKDTAGLKVGDWIEEGSNPEELQGYVITEVTPTTFTMRLPTDREKIVQVLGKWKRKIWGIA